MQKIYYHILKSLLISFLFAGSMISSNTVQAQTCNQVDILTSSPDCLNQKDPTGGAPGQDNRDCKSIAVCVKQKYSYTAAGTWATYLWTVTGPSPISIVPNNTPTVNVTWPSTGTYVLTLTVTDGSGNTFTQCLTVNVKDKPVANFTFTPNNVCAGSTIYFTNTTTSTGPVMYSWSFGDGTYSTATNPTHIYTAPGTYPVMLVAYSFSSTVDSQGHPIITTCCADTIVKRVIITPGNFAIECVSTVCSGDTATYHAVNCANPTWLTPVGGTIIAQTATSVTIVWGNGNVQGQVIAVCPGGCTTAVAVPIIPQNPVPVGNLVPCPTSITSYTLPALPGTFYTWHLNNITANSNHDNALSTLPDNNTVWVNWNGLPPGTYELTINLENKHICCGSSGKITITPKGKFQAYFNQTICKGSGASLSVSPGSGAFQWQVTPAVGVVPPTGSGSSFTPVFTAVGTYIAKVWETTNAYCNSLDTQYIKITVVDSAVSGNIIGPNKACPGSQYTYTMSIPAPSGYIYEWTVTPSGCFQPGCLTSVTGNSVNVLWNTLPGTVTAQLRRNSYPFCPSAARSLTVTQASIGNAAGQQKVCVDDSYSYSLTGGNLPPGENVQWTITPSSLGSVTGGQGTSTPTILWHGQVVGNGPWTAILTATSNCGLDTMHIHISKKPSATITQQFDICTPPNGATLTVNGLPGYTYQWSTGATGTSISNITTTGSYWVDVTNGMCTKRFYHTVEDPFLIEGVKECTPRCNGGAVNENLSVVVKKPGAGTFTYQWYTGLTPVPGNIIPGQTTSAYTTTTWGNFCVEVTYGTCKKSVSFTVEKICCPDVNQPAITSVTRQACDKYTFTGNSVNPGGRPITWDFGDGSPVVPGANGVPMPHTFPGAGVYCVKYCVGAPSPNPTSCTGNCATTIVTVPIQAAFTYTLGCNGCLTVNNISTVITTNPSYVTYSWNFGDGSPVNTSANPPQHCYAGAGNYPVTLTINYNDGQVSCQSIATMNVVYTPLAINMNTPVCTGQQVVMTSTPGSYVSYAWDFGDGFSAYTASTVHVYNTAGPYTVTLTVVDQLGNTCTATKNITVKQGVSNCQIQPAYLCPGQPATLTAPTGMGYSYVWEQYVGGNWVAPVPNSVTNTLTVTTPGWYHVIITNTNGCTCTSDSVEVKAAPKPKAIINASPSNRLCGPGNVTLSTPSLPNHQYAWYANVIAGAPASTSSAYPVYGLGTTTTYFLILQNEYGCRDTCQLTVFVNPVPNPPAINGGSGPYCAGTPRTLTVTNYASNITWNTGATTTSITVSAAGTYTATYTNPATGCSSSSNFVINARPPVDLFPHYCDSIPCNCRKDTLFAPRPLIGAFAAPYNIQWVYNGNPVGTNGNNPFYTPAPAGSYSIIVTDLATGCKDTSKTYTITLPSCDSCDCKGSKWNEITIKEGDGVNAKANLPVQQNLHCKETYTLKCNQPYTVTASFTCAGKKCPPKITYSLQPPTGAPITGTYPPLTFTPTQNGTYTLTLYGWCDGKICDSCVIYFKVECKDCCKGSYWKESPYWKNDKTGKTGKIDCKSTKPIVIKGEDCKASFTVTGSFVCADQTCPPNVVYTLYNASNVVVAGPSSNSITIPTGLPNGNYYLTIQAYCGTMLCDTCRVPIVVDCKQDGCDCKESHWGDITLSEQTGHGNPTDTQTKNIPGTGTPTPGPGPVGIKLNCDKDYTLKCKTPYTVNASYICFPDNCPGSVQYNFTGPMGTSSGFAPFSFTPTVSGVYTLTLYGFCNGKICDTCVIRFKVDCPVDTACCPYDIKVAPKDPSYTNNGNATQVNNSFIINGLGTANITEVRANVVSYTITDNFNKECMKCVNLPFTWASTASAGNIGAVPGKITMFGGVQVPSFNGTGTGVYQNPREVIWNNGNNFSIPNNTAVSMNFLLPPPPAIDCCELKGRICVKFIFRDDQCKECEVIACFDFVIKKK